MEEEKISRIFQLIKKSKPLEDHFFRKLATTDNPFPWFKILKDKGYLDPETNPRPQEVSDTKGYYHIPYWNVIGLLENVAVHNARNPDKEITDLLVETVNSIIGFRDSEGRRIENSKTDWFLVKIIFKLPLERIEDQHIDFISISLRSKWDTTMVASEIVGKVIPYLIGINARDVLVKLLSTILDYRKKELGQFSEYESILGDYWLSEGLRKHKHDIILLCEMAVAKSALAKILEITNAEELRFNQAIIPAIEDNEHAPFPDKYECQLVYLVRDALEGLPPETVRPLVNELIKETHVIFRRIAIHIINWHYSQFQDFFWNWTGNPLDEYGCKHEIYELLKARCESFSDEQIQKIVAWIENKTYFVSDKYDKTPELREQILAYRKREWLTSILKTQNPKVIGLYGELSKINAAEIEHPGYDVWYDTVGIKTTEEKTLDKELLNRTNREIAGYITAYKEKMGLKSEDLLAESLRRIARENAKKFSEEIDPFLSIPRKYQYELLMGLLEAWNSKEEIIWCKIFDFITKIIETEDFWREGYEGFNYRNWIIGAIADLIGDGTKEDSHSFDNKLLPVAEKILLIVADKAESDFSVSGDLVNSVLNSLKGRIFIAMIAYSLRFARLFQIENEVRWPKAIKDHFAKCLHKEQGSSIEFWVTIGQCLPQINYLDSKWTIENINLIFPKDDEQCWKAVFTGYLFFATHLSKGLYVLLRENSHYSKALETRFDDRISNDRVSQHIGVAYLNDLEELGDERSLINQLIVREDPAQLSALIHFFWMLRDKQDDILRHKVKGLWKKLFETLKKNEERPESKRTISSLSHWLVLLDEIDNETVEWIKLSARHIEEIDSLFFVEYLLKHISRTPDKVGAIYLEMLNAGVYPTHKKENIEQLVGVLYDRGQNEAADRICNLYLSKGLDFLVAMYQKHHSEVTK